MRGKVYLIKNSNGEVEYVSLSRANAEEIVLSLYEERAFGRFNGLVNRMGESVEEALKMAATCYWSFTIEEVELV